jgi:hypothetical protein
MSMDPVRGVSQVSQVMEALRRKMSENLETLREAGRLPPTQQTRVRPARPQSAANLRKTITRRLSSVPESDPAFQQKSVNLGGNSGLDRSRARCRQPIRCPVGRSPSAEDSISPRPHPARGRFFS